jgi:chemotaxis protein MotA
MELVIAGIVNIQSGANPRLVSQKLRSMLPPGTAPADDKKAA